jgi:hypothetical protein
MLQGDGVRENGGGHEAGVEQSERDDHGCVGVLESEGTQGNHRGDVHHHEQSVERDEAIRQHSPEERGDQHRSRAA